MKSRKKSKQRDNSIFGTAFNNKRLTALMVFVIVFASLGAYLISTSQAYNSSVETDQFSQLNNYRTGHGKPAIVENNCLTKKSRAWAKHLAEVQHLEYSYEFDSGNEFIKDEVHYLLCGGTHISENIGHGLLPEYVFANLDQTPKHKANMLDSEFTSVGIGAVKDKDGLWWIVQSFSN